MLSGIRSVSVDTHWHMLFAVATYYLYHFTMLHLTINTDVLCIITGGTVSVILDLPSSYSIVVSAAVAVIYTLLGGFYSVAYTDVIQLVIIFISMVNTACCKQPQQ